MTRPEIRSHVNRFNWAIGLRVWVLPSQVVFGMGLGPWLVELTFWRPGK